MSVNREGESNHLDKCYPFDQTQLLIFHRRRRVGKTGLLRAFREGKPHVFFIATLSSDQDQLAAFSEAVWELNRDQVADAHCTP